MRRYLHIWLLLPLLDRCWFSLAWLVAWSLRRLVFLFLKGSSNFLGGCLLLTQLFPGLGEQLGWLQTIVRPLVFCTFWSILLSGGVYLAIGVSSFIHKAVLILSHAQPLSSALHEGIVKETCKKGMYIHSHVAWVHTSRFEPFRYHLFLLCEIAGWARAGDLNLAQRRSWHAIGLILFIKSLNMIWRRRQRSYVMMYVRS